MILNPCLKMSCVKAIVQLGSRLPTTDPPESDAIFADLKNCRSAERTMLVHQQRALNAIAEHKPE